MPLPERAYEGLFGKPATKRLTIEYSGRLKHFNAHIIEKPFEIAFKLSKEFLEVDDELRIGVMQQLLVKLHRRHGERPPQTLEMDLYNRFLKNLGDYKTAGGRTIEDEELARSFARVNAAYFDNYLLAPHLTWAGDSRTQLGRYTFADDTVTISRVLRGAGEVLDYVVYHELLHKKHKFTHKDGRTRSHTKAFRDDERKFRMADGRDPEKALQEWLRGAGKRRQPGGRGRLKSQSVIRKLFDYFYF